MRLLFISWQDNIFWISLLQDEYEEVVNLVLRLECSEIDSYILISDLNNSDVVKQNSQKTGEPLVTLLQHKRTWIDRQEAGILIKNV